MSRRKLASRGNGGSSSKSLNQQLDDLQKKVGFFFTAWLNWHLSHDLKERVRMRLESPPAHDRRELDRLVRVAREFVFQKKL